MYYHDPIKSILIVHPDNLEMGKIFGANHGFTVCMGARYLWGYIRDDKSKHDWLRNWREKWKRKTHAVTKTAGKYPK